MGSLVCAMASFLDARAHDGTWLIRIEDIDPPRDVPGADKDILAVLTDLAMESDRPVLWQHDRLGAYTEVLDRLKSDGLVYGCACSRKEVELANRALGFTGMRYPGTCRTGTGVRDVRAWRFTTADEDVTFLDRSSGSVKQNVNREVGDFVVFRADGLWAYQLAVVADDAYQGINNVVRGEDLLDNTARQIALGRALGYQTPQYLHIPLVRDADGNKLSKQTLAPAVSTESPLALLETAWSYFNGKKIGADTVAAFWTCATELWRTQVLES